jgi:20S proteasome alpha/beta subunit
MFTSTIIWLNPHSYSLTVFSPSGKLVQIEHALAAVSQGTTSLGIKGDVSAYLVGFNQSFRHILRSFEWDSHRN